MVYESMKKKSESDHNVKPRETNLSNIEPIVDKGTMEKGRRKNMLSKGLRKLGKSTSVLNFNVLLNGDKDAYNVSKQEEKNSKAGMADVHVVGSMESPTLKNASDESMLLHILKKSDVTNEHSCSEVPNNLEATAMLKDEVFTSQPEKGIYDLENTSDASFSSLDPRIVARTDFISNCHSSAQKIENDLALEGASHSYFSKNSQVRDNVVNGQDDTLTDGKYLERVRSREESGQKIRCFPLKSTSIKVKNVATSLKDNYYLLEKQPASVLAPNNPEFLELCDLPDSRVVDRLFEKLLSRRVFSETALRTLRAESTERKWELLLSDRSTLNEDEDFIAILKSDSNLNEELPRKIANDVKREKLPTRLSSFTVLETSMESVNGTREKLLHMEPESGFSRTSNYLLSNPFQRKLRYKEGQAEWFVERIISSKLSPKEYRKLLKKLDVKSNSKNSRAWISSFLEAQGETALSVVLSRINKKSIKSNKELEKEFVIIKCLKNLLNADEAGSFSGGTKSSGNMETSPIIVDNKHQIIKGMIFSLLSPRLSTRTLVTEIFVYLCYYKCQRLVPVILDAFVGLQDFWGDFLRFDSWLKAIEEPLEQHRCVENLSLEMDYNLKDYLLTSLLFINAMLKETKSLNKRANIRKELTQSGLSAIFNRLEPVSNDRINDEIDRYNFFAEDDYCELYNHKFELDELQDNIFMDDNASEDLHLIINSDSQKREDIVDTILKKIILLRDSSVKETGTGKFLYLVNIIIDKFIRDHPNIKKHKTEAVPSTILNEGEIERLQGKYIEAQKFVHNNNVPNQESHNGMLRKDGEIEDLKKQINLLQLQVRSLERDNIRISKFKRLSLDAGFKNELEEIFSKDASFKVKNNVKYTLARPKAEESLLRKTPYSNARPFSLAVSEGVFEEFDFHESAVNLSSVEGSNRTEIRDNKSHIILGQENVPQVNATLRTSSSDRCSSMPPAQPPPPAPPLPYFMHHVAAAGADTEKLSSSVSQCPLAPPPPPPLPNFMNNNQSDTASSLKYVNLELESSQPVVPAPAPAPPPPPPPPPPSLFPSNKENNILLRNESTSSLQFESESEKNINAKEDQDGNVIESLENSSGPIKAIKPKRKLKQMHWSKLDDIDNTFWNDLEDENLSNKLLSRGVLGAVEKAFASKESTIKLKKSLKEKAGNSTNLITILSRDVVQQIEINLHMFSNTPVDELVRKVLHCNLDIIENLSVLEFFSVPSLLDIGDKVVRGFEPYASTFQNGEIKVPSKLPHDLGRSDQIYLQLCFNLRHYWSSRSRALLFVQTYRKENSDLLKKLYLVDEANRLIKESDCLKNVLGVIRSVGNFMNDSSKQALGFKLDTLQRLKFMKDDTNTLTFLHHVEKIIRNIFPEFCSFVDELAPLHQVCNLSIEQIEYECQEFNSSISNIASSLTKGNLSDSSKFHPEDRILKAIKEPLEDAKLKGRLLKSHLENTINDFNRLVEYFGESINDADARNLFFGKFWNFLVEYKKAHVENIQKEEEQQTLLNRKKLLEKSRPPQDMRTTGRSVKMKRHEADENEDDEYDEEEDHTSENMDTDIFSKKKELSNTAVVDDLLERLKHRNNFISPSGRAKEKEAKIFGRYAVSLYSGKSFDNLLEQGCNDALPSSSNSYERVDSLRRRLSTRKNQLASVEKRLCNDASKNRTPIPLEDPSTDVMIRAQSMLNELRGLLQDKETKV